MDAKETVTDGIPCQVNMAKKREWEGQNGDG